THVSPSLAKSDLDIQTPTLEHNTVPRTISTELTGLQTTPSSVTSPSPAPLKSVSSDTGVAASSPVTPAPTPTNPAEESKEEKKKSNKRKVMMEILGCDESRNFVLVSCRLDTSHKSVTFQFAPGTDKPNTIATKLLAEDCLLKIHVHIVEAQLGEVIQLVSSDSKKGVGTKLATVLDPNSAEPPTITAVMPKDSGAAAAPVKPRIEIVKTPPQRDASQEPNNVQVTNVRKVSQESNAESVQSIPRPAEIVVTSPTNETSAPTPAPKPSRFQVTKSADPIAATPTVTPVITSVPVVESNVSVVVPPVTSIASTHLATPSPVSHSFSSNSSPSATTHSNTSSIQSTNSVPGRRFTVQPVSQAESGISSSISTPHPESSGHTGPPPVPSVPPVVSTASLNLEVVQTPIQLTSGDLQQSSSTASTATLVSDTPVEAAVPSQEQPVVQSDVLTQLESELRKVSGVSHSASPSTVVESQTSMTPQTVPLVNQIAANAAPNIPNASVPQSPSRLDAENGLAGLHERLEALKMEQDRREDGDEEVTTADGKEGKDEIPIDTLKGLAEALGKVIHTDGRETTPMPPDQADLTDASTQHLVSPPNPDASASCVGEESLSTTLVEDVAPGDVTLTSNSTAPEPIPIPSAVTDQECAQSMTSSKTEPEPRMTRSTTGTKLATFENLETALSSTLGTHIRQPNAPSSRDETTAPMTPSFTNERSGCGGNGTSFSIGTPPSHSPLPVSECDYDIKAQMDLDGEDPEVIQMIVRHRMEQHKLLEKQRVEIERLRSKLRVSRATSVHPDMVEGEADDTGTANSSFQTAIVNSSFSLPASPPPNIESTKLDPETYRLTFKRANHYTTRVTRT
uniref:Serine/threonine-protein kinase WNK CCTL2 domain-containing protein n=1 Tax=Caenorhabditis japonica TaxID=281687 RepID=A0A8R1I8P6_CAEJA